MPYLKSAPSNLSICKISRKKCLNFESKMPYLGFSGKNFKKLLSNLKSALSNLSTCKISRKKQMSKFGTKNALLWYFWARIWKNYCHIWNQHLWIILITKFRKRASIPKFQTKKWLIWVLLGYNLKKLLSYLKLAISNLSKWVFNSSSEFWYRVRFFSRSGVRFF